MVATRRGVSVSTPSVNKSDESSDVQVTPLRSARRKAAVRVESPTRNDSEQESSRLEKPSSPQPRLKRCTRSLRLHSPDHLCTPTGSTQEADESDLESVCSVVSNPEPLLTRSTRRRALLRTVDRDRGETSEAESSTSVVSATPSGRRSRRKAPEIPSEKEDTETVSATVPKSLRKSTKLQPEDVEASDAESCSSFASGPTASVRRSTRTRRDQLASVHIDETPDRTASPRGLRTRAAKADSDGFESGSNFSIDNVRRGRRRGPKNTDSDSDLTDIHSSPASPLSTRGRGTPSSSRTGSGRSNRGVSVKKCTVVLKMNAVDGVLDDYVFERTLVSDDADCTLVEEDDGKTPEEQDILMLEESSAGEGLEDGGPDEEKKSTPETEEEVAVTSAGQQEAQAVEEESVSAMEEVQETTPQEPCEPRGPAAVTVCEDDDDTDGSETKTSQSITVRPGQAQQVAVDWNTDQEQVVLELDSDTDEQEDVLDSNTEQEKVDLDLKTEQEPVVLDSKPEQEQVILDLDSDTEEPQVVLESDTEQEKVDEDLKTEQEPVIMDLDSVNDQKKIILDLDSDTDQQQSDIVVQKTKRVSLKEKTVILDSKTEQEQLILNLDSDTEEPQVSLESDTEQEKVDEDLKTEQEPVVLYSDTDEKEVVLDSKPEQEQVIMDLDSVNEQKKIILDLDSDTDQQQSDIVVQKPKRVSLLDSSDDDYSEEEDADEEPREQTSNKSKTAAECVDGLFMIDTRPGVQADDDYYKGRPDEEESVRRGEDGEDKIMEVDDEDEDDEDDEEDDDDDDARFLFASRDPHVKELSSRIDPGIRVKDLGGLYINFDGGKSKPASSSWQKLKEKKSHDEVMKKSVMGADFEKKDVLPPYKESKNRLKLKNKAEREKTTGDGWFNMKAPEMTKELKDDLNLLKIRGSLDPKRFYKKNDRDGLPKYFQIGTVMGSSADFFHSHVPKKQRKRTMVEELLVDAEFRHANKKRYQQIVTEKAAEAAGKRRKKKNKFQRKPI